MNKSESEVSKWLNGVQNFTLKTLTKLEAALNNDILTIPSNKKSDFKYVGTIFRHSQIENEKYVWFVSHKKFKSTFPTKELEEVMAI